MGSEPAARAGHSRSACCSAWKHQITRPLTPLSRRLIWSLISLLPPWKQTVGSGCTACPFRPEQTFSDLAPSCLEGLSLCLSFPRIPLSQVTRAFLIVFPRKSVASPSPGDNYIDLGPFSSGTSQASTTPTLPLFKYKGCKFSHFLF